MAELPCMNRPLETRYAELWANFGASKVLRPPRRRRFRARRAAILVRIADGALFRRLDRIRHALAGFPNLVPVPDHSLQLPVLDLGRVGSRALPAAVARAQALVDGVPAFGVDLARVNVDEREVFAELHPPGPMTALRRRLLDLTIDGPVDEPYLPRVPLATLVGPVDAVALHRALEWFRDRPIGGVRVDRLMLASVAGGQLYPAIERVAELRLAL